MVYYPMVDFFQPSTLYTLTVSAASGSSFPFGIYATFWLGDGGGVPSVSGRPEWWIPFSSISSTFMDFSVAINTEDYPEIVGRSFGFALGLASDSWDEPSVVYFDNLRATATPIPEPSSLAMILSAIVLVCAGVARRHQRQN
jgi:hypothetical protein